MTVSRTLPAVRMTTAARRLGLGAALLLAWSGVGGIVSVRLGVNTWSDAWGPAATLAAPWPMVLVQSVAAALAVFGRRRRAVGGTSVLFAASLLSAVSGFFDGQFARADLSGVHVALQVGLIATATVVAALAGLRLRELLSGR